MDPISLIVLVALIGGASVFLDRKWQARKAKEITAAPDTAAADVAPDSEAQPQSASFFSRTSDKAQALGSQAVDRAKTLGTQVSSQTKTITEKAGTQTKALREQAVTQAQSLRERIPTPKKSTLPEEFRRWVTQAAADDPALRTWLASLGEEQFADFTGHVADFCTSVGFDLAWLVNGEFDKMPGLVANAEQVALNYCRSCAQAAAAQTELNAFRRYRAYAQNHDSRKERVYGEKLLDHLLDLGLTTVSLSDFLSVSAQEKQEHVWQAIQAAAEKDAAAFNRALLDMTTEESQPATQTDPLPAAA